MFRLLVLLVVASTAEVVPIRMLFEPMVPPLMVIALSIPPSPREPASVLVKVSVLAEPVMVVDAVRPLNAVEEVANVTVGPV